MKYTIEVEIHLNADFAVEDIPPEYIAADLRRYVERTYAQAVMVRVIPDDES